jgi:hypothetical protein
MDTFADARERGHNSLESLAMVVATSGLPVNLIPKLQKVHEEGFTLAAFADAVLLAHADRLSACGRCKDRLCDSCTQWGFARRRQHRE